MQKHGKTGEEVIINASFGDKLLILRFSLVHHKQTGIGLYRKRCIQRAFELRIGRMPAEKIQRELVGLYGANAPWINDLTVTMLDNKKAVEMEAART